MDSLRAVWVRLKPYIPDLFLKGRLNFITIHYLYIGGMALLGSVLIFAIGGMPYIDALFFASGAVTQSGLNTIDVNNIRLSQQIIIYFFAMVCNPIVVHSSVVFVRLYMFEKRFKHVVQEARALRRSKSKSRYPSKAKEDPELGRKEEGVRGRSIVVLRDGHVVDGDLEDEKAKANAAAESVASSSPHKESVTSSDDTVQGEMPLERRGAIGTDGSVDEEIRSPPRLDVDHHIAFLENQRSPKDKGALRIPSPREFDRGGRPQDVSDEEAAALTRKITSPPDRPVFGGVDFGRTPTTANHITINEPKISRSRDRTNTFSKVESDKTTTMASSAEPSPRFLSKVRSRSRTATGFRELIRANTNFLRSKEEEPEEAPYLSWVPTIVRNSTFVNLNEEQREELGGIEYRALKTLAIVLIGYYFAFHLLGLISLTPWIMNSGTYGPLVQDFGIGRPWWGIFTAASAFNDLGFTLTPDSMISFNTALFPLLLMTFLIIIGNTGFPCMLRFVIWFSAKLTRRGTGLWEELRFLLDHPRRCFTLLFPAAATWWLFAILIILNGLDVLLFVILDLKKDPVQDLPAGLRFVDGLFQAASTRTAGFSVVNLAALHAAVQVSYLIMMYVSVFPIAISVRRTNVYEEKSLGIYGTVSDTDDEGNDKEPSYVGAHLRRQLSFDLWYVFLGLFVISIVEGRRIENANDFAFTHFSILFEIISAYGTVGLSLGYPTANTSFSGQFKTLSKLVIIAMQIRGRHRGLPYELDRAVLLPSESLHEKEAAEAKKMLARRRTSLTNMSTRNELSRSKSGPQNGGPRPFPPFAPSPLTQQTATAAQMDPDMGHKLAADFEDSPTPSSDKQTSRGIRAGLGNAMFRLASPLHKKSYEREPDATTKRD